MCDYMLVDKIYFLLHCKRHSGEHACGQDLEMSITGIQN